MLSHPRFTKPCLIFVLFLTCALLTSCNAMAFIAPTPTPTQTLTPTVTSTPTITPTSTATVPPTQTATPTIPPTPTLQAGWTTFETEAIALAYPKSWVVDDRTHDEKCIPGIIDCVLRLLAPEDQDTKITLVRMDFSMLGADAKVEKLDQVLWDAEPSLYKDLGLEGQVKLESKTDLQVGGSTGGQTYIQRTAGEQWASGWDALRRAVACYL